MNDRFKFRSYDKENKVYLYDIQKMYDCDFAEKITQIPFEKYLIPSFDCFDDFLKDDSYIIEQSTGLKDKNGVLIYEGDKVMQKSTLQSIKGEIVKVEKDGSVGYVKWIDGIKGFKIVYDYELDNYYETDFCNLACDFEVIGNIHSQP